ncbi:MAG TPA: acyltransferase family protein [Steroidobacteraceae bacterium]|nr:acyltransferase family protein [Steroidobacteraceae bacterium]
MTGAAPITSPRGRTSDYRPDIDGLRAIAVLLVVLYHYGVPGFRGGFVGVDVFFVISGFLITAHIAADLRAGRFSLLAFYERRIRRILPALFVMYGLVLLAGTVVLFPPELRFLSRIGAYVVPFLANFALYRNAGMYGGQFADQVVLLHTWSLAVEEQFYLFFPVLMLAIAALCRTRYAAVLWPLALISFAACVVAVRFFPLAAFYLAPFRAWELLAGALLALGQFAPPRIAGMRTAAALVGLALIAIADLVLSIDSPYPSELTLLPCLGAVLILHATCDRGSAPGALLCHGVLRRIGLWSYSLYLVHWPLLLLAKYYAFDPLSVTARIVLLGATLLLAALSWRYVEQPFRGANALLSRRGLFAVASVSGLALMGATVAIEHATDPRRYDSVDRIRFPSEIGPEVACHTSSLEASQGPPCIVGDRSVPVSTVVWGDSHAAAMLPAIDSTFMRHHQAALYVKGGCAALEGVYPRERAPGQTAAMRAWMDGIGMGHGVKCEQGNAAALNWIIQQRITTVILGGHWIANTEARFMSVLTDDQDPGNDGAHNAEVFARGLGRLLADLQRAQVRVYLLDDVPLYSFSIPYGLAAARRLDLRRDLGLTRSEYEAQQRSATRLFMKLQAQYGLRILKPQDVLCNSDHCAVAHGEAPLYRDNEHLSITGAMTVEPVFEAVFGP